MKVYVQFSIHKNIFYITGSVNVALNKPATQSSTWTPSSHLYTADKAVDGDQNSFTYTADNQHPSWWKVDLQDIYSIETIILISPTLSGSKYCARMKRLLMSQQIYSIIKS